PGARGCHQLIRQGATQVESGEDVLQALRGWQQLAPAPQMDEPERPQGHLLLDPLLAAPTRSEALAQALGQSLAQVLAELTELEIEGRVACEHGQWSARAG